MMVNECACAVCGFLWVVVVAMACGAPDGGGVLHIQSIVFIKLNRSSVIKLWVVSFRQPHAVASV
eukprot:scaffold16288_cov154-Isochrysis_galbana.AAC.2